MGVDPGHSHRNGHSFQPVVLALQQMGGVSIVPVWRLFICLCQRDSTRGISTRREHYAASYTCCLHDYPWRSSRPFERVRSCSLGRSMGTMGLSVEENRSHRQEDSAILETCRRNHLGRFAGPTLSIPSACWRNKSRDFFS